MIKLDDGDAYLTKQEWCAAVSVETSRYCGVDKDIAPWEQPDMLVWPEQGYPLWRKSRVATYWKEYQADKERRAKASRDAKNAKSRSRC